MSKSIVLLSGGLDSLVSLGLAKDEFNVRLALTFDYGQKSSLREIEASRKICTHYGIEHKIIKQDWLREITHTALVSSAGIPCGIQENSKTVWVPNRNGLFLNIAASFADSYDFDYIIIGANKEEGQTFPDNTEEFVKRINVAFELSTLKKPVVIAPLINSGKSDIVKEALKNSMPLEYIHSCYYGGSKHCGVCESCVRLKNALQNNNHSMGEFFEN
ncbi:MAG: 7-cyano-7-deazaguanine synthase QueC [Heliobacteriaceae bacterium]|nr:7-cyano-7-deazaguanine synthase QueC [Heliobacteriaceae bacterium]